MDCDEALLILPGGACPPGRCPDGMPACEDGPPLEKPPLPGADELRGSFGLLNGVDELP